jgi:hypothetical protein
MWPRLLLTLGALLLLVTAAFHANGLAMVGAWFNDERAGVMRMLWLTPTIDWTLVALFWVFVAARPRAELRVLVIAAALLPLASAVGLFVAVGAAHPGPLMLAGSAALAVVGAALLDVRPPAV